LLDGHVDHPVVAGCGGDRHHRSGDGKILLDRAHVRLHQPGAALGFVHGGDAGFAQPPDDLRVGAVDMLSDNRHFNDPS
jgi:hypothetical protein